MFDRIAPTYDRLNRLLSLRSDVRWRDCVARALAARRVRSVLDVATGTGDLLLAIDRRLPRLTRTVGVDLAPDMLHIARDKLARAGCAAKLTLGDAHRLPFEEHSFDAVTVAFGIRNMDDRPRALTEMRRVLAGGGTLAVLEFSLPGVSAVARAVPDLLPPRAAGGRQAHLRRRARLPLPECLGGSHSPPGRTSWRCCGRPASRRSSPAASRSGSPCCTWHASHEAASPRAILTPSA